MPGRRTLLAVVLFPLLSGCGAAKFYRAPVARFETGVNQTASTVEPYFIDLNRMESKYRLLDKVHDNKDWGTEDLAPRFSPEAIQIRVQALELIKKYARLLSDIAGSSAPKDYQEAADGLGKEVQGLADTVAKLGGAKGVPQIGDPLGKLVNFLGQIKIERERKKALQTAIRAGEEPINELIQLLREDTIAAAALWYQDLKQREAVLLPLYNAQRKSAASPEDLESLINNFLDSGREADVISTLAIRQLFDDLQAAHNALVSFAKSGARPSGVAGLAAQIDVFAQQAQLVAQLVQSFRAAKRGA